MKRTLSDKTFDGINGAILFALTLIFLYPLYFVLIASISEPYEVVQGNVLFWPRGFTLTAYQNVLRESSVWTGYRNSIFYTLLGTAYNLVLTIPAAYVLTKQHMPGRGLLTAYFFITMYFSGGLIQTYLIVKQLHLVNTIWVMMTLGTLSVYNIIIARSFFASTIPEELREAAFVDGCGNGKFFFSIVLPLSKAIVAVITLYYAVGHWNSFFQALIYLNRQQLYPLQLVLRDILISSQLIQTGETDVEMLLEMQRIAETIKYGVIIVSSVPVMLLYPFVQKYFIKGVMIGSIKG